MFRLLVLSSVLVCCTLGAIIPKGLVPMLDGRIVGGQATTIEEFPHQISMRYFGSHRCGGSIISERVIVSAAHCVDGVSASSLKIVVGTTSRQNGGKSYSVQKIIQHELYDRGSINNDISLLILSESLVFGDSVQPIDLVGHGAEIEDGTRAIVSGWGSLREGGGGSNVLQYVGVNVINQEDCIKAYSGIGAKITSKMLCAGAKNGGKDSCQGDSGGPLISGGQLIGVVSWGYGCARPQYPGVYARVSALRKWVDENSNDF